MIKWLVPIALGGCADLLGITAPRDLAVVELTVSAGTLAPSFDPALVSYELAVVHGDTTLEVHAEANDPQATIDIAGIQSELGTRAVAVPVGDSTIDIVAHTESGVRVTYQVHVHRPEVVIAFAPPRAVQTQAPGMIDRVAIGDFDADGTDDLAAVTGFGDIAVMTNDGNVQFTPRDLHPWGNLVRTVATHDVDGDGRPELIATAGGDFRIAPNLGGGSFAAPFGCGAGPQPGAFALFQLDGDGRLDLAVADQTGRLGIYTAPVPPAAPSCWSPHPAFDQYPATTELAAVVAGSFDATPGDDLATLDPVSRTIHVHHNQPTALATTTLGLPTDARPVELAAADVDDDGRHELVWIDRANDEVVVQPVQGPPQNKIRVDGTPRSLTVTDVDGDGHVDLIVLVDGGVVVLHNDGSGTFAPRPIAMTLSGVQRLAVGDFNGDGRADLATANFTQTVFVHLGVAP